MDDDPALWVRLGAGWSPEPGLHWLITGNAHTFPGRFGVWSPDLDETRTVDLADTIEVSPAARRWLDGFLAGQEVGPAEFAGGAGRLYERGEYDPDLLARWQEWNARLRTSGRLPPVGTLPPDDPAWSELGAPAPWVHVAGRYRLWDGSAWVLADPQPADDPAAAYAWPGSACADGPCSLDEHAGRLVCVRCHHVGAEIVPDEEAGSGPRPPTTLRTWAVRR